MSHWIPHTLITQVSKSKFQILNSRVFKFSNLKLNGVPFMQLSRNWRYYIKKKKKNWRFLINTRSSYRFDYATCMDSMPLSLTFSWTSGNTNACACPSASPLGESLGHTCSRGSPPRGSVQTSATTSLLCSPALRHNRPSSLNGFCLIRYSNYYT